MNKMNEALLAVVADMRKCAPTRDKVWMLGVYNSTINEWADKIEEIVKENDQGRIENP